MRVFLTGASGFIGSAVVPELLGAGYEVVGLARSEDAAAAISSAGAAVHHGSLDDLDALRAGAAGSDGVIHLAFIHDFANFEAAAQTDLRAIEALGAELEGSGRPLVIASGLLGLPPGRPATEEDVPDPTVAGPRATAAQATLALAARGVRSSVVRLAPTVHGAGDHGFVPTLIGIARERGVSGYIGDGANRWPAVHQLDAAHLFRLAVERAPAGSVLHGAAEEGVPVRGIADAVGRHLHLPVVSIPPAEAGEHFGWLARVLAADVAASSALTRERMGWRPAQPGLLDDLEQGHYFAGPRVSAPRR